MLTKINEIKNVGQFEEFLPSKVFDKNTVRESMNEGTARLWSKN